MSDIKNILLIDHKIQRRDMLASRFRMQGYNVDLANGGFHSLHMVENTEYRSVIIIGNTHDMPGIEILELIRGMYTKHDLQILMVGRTSNQEDVLEAFSAGASEYLVYDDKIFMPLLEKINAFKVPETRERKFLMDSTMDDAEDMAKEVDSLGE